MLNSEKHTAAQNYPHNYAKVNLKPHIRIYKLINSTVKHHERRQLEWIYKLNACNFIDNEQHDYHQCLCCYEL